MGTDVGQVLSFLNLPTSGGENTEKSAKNGNDA